MNAKENIEKRVSIRSYTDEKVPVGDLMEICRLGSCAPSINNYQPWNFIAIANKDLQKKMSTAVTEVLRDLKLNNSRYATNIKTQVEYFSTFFKDAPAIIALVLEPYETILEKGVELTHDAINEKRKYPDMQMAGACIQNMLLAATYLGYGACWLSGPLIAAEALEKMLDISISNQLVAFVSVGVPAVILAPKIKKPIEKLFRYIE